MQDSQKGLGPGTPFVLEAAFMLHALNEALTHSALLVQPLGPGASLPLRQVALPLNQATAPDATELPGQQNLLRCQCSGSMS